MNNIADAAGNQPAVTSIPYSADLVGPTATPGIANFSTMSTLTELDITFSESVFGADNINNYTVHGAGAGSLAVDSVSPISSAAYRITFTGDLSNGNFSIRMHGIADAMENQVANDT
jgi:hypothetical protein